MSEQREQRKVPQPPPYMQQRQKSRWWIPILVIAILVIGFLVFVAGAIAIFISTFEKSPIVVRNNTVLVLDAKGTVLERIPQSPLSLLTTPVAPTHWEILQAIRFASRDTNIQAIAFETAKIRADWVKATEIIAALDTFRSTGRPIYAYIENGDELDYYLASAADTIFMNPHGLIEFNGFSIVGLFLKDALAKLGVNFHVEALEEYKSAGESLSRTSFSKAAKEEYRSILKKYHQHFLSTIARRRGIPTDTLSTLMEKGIYLPTQLKKYHLIDTLATYANYLAFLESRFSGGMSNSPSVSKASLQEKELEQSGTRSKLRTITISKYLSSTSFIAQQEKAERAEKTIAIVIGAGAIVPGPQDQMDNSPLITEEEYVKYFEELAEDETINGVIFRINSPGGSAAASEGILTAINKVRKKKPVYALMSDVAASGGYYIASHCDTIIAHPLTITGSIGVILMYPDFSATLHKLHITADSISSNSNAAEFVSVFPLETKEKQKLHQLAKYSYNLFLQRVAEGRGMDTAAIRTIAKGRVWTGDTAVKIGLVDLLGDYFTALSLMKKRIGVADTTPVRVVIYPKPKDPFERIAELLFQDIFGATISPKNSELEFLLSYIPQPYRSTIESAYLLLKRATAGERIFLLHPSIPIIR